MSCLRLDFRHWPKRPTSSFSLAWETEQVYASLEKAMEATASNISTTSVPRRLLWWTLLVVPLILLPFFFGLFSGLVIVSGLLVGCVFFMDILRMATKPTVQPLAFQIIAPLIWVMIRPRELGYEANLALAGQGVGLFMLTGFWLSYYFRDTIAKVSASSIKVTT